MPRNVSTIGFLLALLLVGAGAAVVAMAQDRMDDREEGGDEELVPGAAEVRGLAPSPLELGADLGNGCICLCRAGADPKQQEWSYFERSLLSGCNWTGRLCVTGGLLGTIGACVAAPAPLD